MITGMRWMDQEERTGWRWCSIVDPGSLLATGSLLSAGGNIFSSIFGASGAKQQASAIRYAADVARQTALDINQRAREDLAPFRQYGVRAGDTLMDILGGKVSLQDLYGSSALYDWQSWLGTRGINRQLAQRGLYNSGAGLEALAMFEKGLAAEEGNRLWDRLAGLTSLGANSAAQQAISTTQTGNALLQSLTQLGAAQAGAIGQRYQSLGQLGPGIAGPLAGGLSSYLGYELFSPLIQQLAGQGNPSQEAIGRSIVESSLAMFNR